MDAQFKRCVIYVDYEDLLVMLSRIQYLNIEHLLVHLLEKARQCFTVQQAFVFGAWTYQPNLAQLADLGFLCCSRSHMEANLQQEPHGRLNGRLADSQSVDAYILVSGQSSYSALITACLQAHKDCLLWTLTPPSPSDQALCTEWEPITLPDTAKSHAWPRQVMLQAIALAADHLHTDAKARFSLRQLRDHLTHLIPFQHRADTWLTIAIGEQILLPQRLAGEVYGSLNRHHMLVQKALIIRERVLLTLNALQLNREWVAFSALEKALHSALVLAEEQSLRHAWLELLVAEQVLVSGQLPQHEGSFQVTTLCLNPVHPVVATLPQLQQYNLVRLIVLMSNFIDRKHSTWMAVSKLLKCLTSITTRVEARAALSIAEQQGIIFIESLSMPSQAKFPITVVRLQHDHALVQRTLTLRDQLIQFINTFQEQRNIGISEIVLAEKCSAAIHISEDDALFWLRLLVSEGLLHIEPMPLGPQETMPILYLNQQDTIVDQLLSSVSKTIREVQE